MHCKAGRAEGKLAKSESAEVHAESFFCQEVFVKIQCDFLSAQVETF